MEKIKIGIIGHGRFGTLVEEIINENFKDIEIIIFDKGSNFTKVKNCNTVIIAVPISSFEEAVLEIRDFIRPHTLLIDVCSVKVHPVKIMKKFLPEDVDIIATHPLFGPDSIKNGLEGLKIVLHKTRCCKSKFEKFTQLLQTLGLVTIEMKPKTHDRLMARSQVFTHIIGRIGNGIKLKSTDIDTKTFEKFLEIQEIVTNDTFELFRDMNLFNPFAKDIRTQIKLELDNLERQI